MADEVIAGKIMIKGYKNLPDDAFEIVRLAVGSDTAVAGDFVTYKGKVTAATPGTHRDVTLASAVAFGSQTTADPNGWCGQILEPQIIPSESYVNGTTALIDGTLVRILKRGAGNGVTTRAIYTDASDNVLPGNMLSLSSTGGELRKTVNAFTVPTVAENANAMLSHMLERIGYADAVAEDVAGSKIIVNVTWC